MQYNTLFIVPPTKSLTVSPPLGLLYLATILQKAGIAVKIIDSLKENLSWEQLYKTIADIQPENICLSVMTPRLPSVKEFIRDIRHKQPNVKIILGGPHITALPRESFAELQPDVLVKGEAENIILPLIQILNSKQLEKLNGLTGIVFRRPDGEIVETTGENHVADLNALPLPDWTLLPPGEYPPKPANLFYKAFPIGSIITSRGCKYNCPFCASRQTFGAKIRYRAPEHVLQEIKLLTERHGVKEIHFLDDNFVNNKAHAYAICRAILDSNIKIHWKVPGGLKINDLDAELIDIFKKSGCYQLGFGLETLDKTVQKMNRKIIDLDKSVEIVKKLRKNKIETYGYFIIGLPGETSETIKNTFRLLKKFSFDYYHFSLFTPTPGSEYFQKFQPPQDWSKYLFTNGTQQSYCDLTLAELKKYQRQALLKSACNFRTITKIIRYIKPAQLKYFAELILSYWQKT
ncbi:MAG: B12-binding domain-containing radical SAM protein [Candidatus Margulisbacteria bacterium]|jgi:radical SAM superfamily enzyme YgiQ (UPF0313 family)|nr:B12-binding domain-containing radical SAM protein [Candidatus Margulisiibacteriota bacterium]